MQNQNSPAQYIPPSIPQQVTQPQEEPANIEEIIFQQMIQTLRPQRVVFTFPLIPTFSIIRIIGDGSEENQRTSVADEKY